MDIIKIPLKNYVHILDSTTNITYLAEGPQNYTLQSNEIVVKNISSFIQLRNNSYVVISNPLMRDDKGLPLLEDFGQVKLDWGGEEIRTSIDYKDPFPLYPGEILSKNVTNFEMILADEQLHIKAIRPFYDSKNELNRIPGDEWMLKGPINYIPRIEEMVVGKHKAIINSNNCAIKVRAIRDTQDKYGKDRKAGEEWLIREHGAYLRSIDEDIIEKNISSMTLTDNDAIYLTAKHNFTDIYGIKRKAGDKWIVTNSFKDSHIADVYEEFVGWVKLTVLSSREYCVILNPVESGITQYGKRVLRRGETSFFLQPGESLEDGKVKSVIVLDENDALLLQANKAYEDNGVKYNPGDRWTLRGPREFIPPLELTILKQIKAIPLDENEGIYVREMDTGDIKIITGQTYLLSANEELWEKKLSPLAESLIFNQFGTTAITEVDEKGELTYSNNKKISVKNRDLSKVVTFRSPQNSAVQVFDFKTLKSRVVFGPELIKLGPHEEFTILNLSGKKPKVENQINTIPLLLGPDFMTDIIEVETKDHARLRLQLCYSWKFDLQDKTNFAEVNKLFKVNDFIGDACKNLAEKIRGSVSTVQFEVFHKNSASIVKSAVFGVDKNNMTKNSLKFNANNLLIINVDIHNQEPIDAKTRENLSKSTNLSIQSQNAMQQADTEHRQKIITEENKGKLQLQVLDDNTTSEKQNIEYLKKKIETEVVKTTGQLKAKANATARRFEIEGESLVTQSKMKVEALEIESMSELLQKELQIKEEMRRKEELIDLELEKARKLANIEVEEFSKTIKAIGRETIISMARAGPEVQAKLLKSLGIKSFLITDGKNPINLFNTAKGIVKDKQ